MREVHSHNLRTPFEKKLYRCWKLMKSRCNNKNVPAYVRYGGAGITVCKRWNNSFRNFREDVGLPPTMIHTLDRYPNNKGNYEPGNCRWATKSEQACNRKTTVLLTLNGKTMPMKKWAAEIGISHKILWARLNHLGWSVEKTLTTPIVPHGYTTLGRI